MFWFFPNWNNDLPLQYVVMVTEKQKKDRFENLILGKRMIKE